MGFQFQRRLQQQSQSQPEASLGGSQMAGRPQFALWNPGLWDADSVDQWERPDQRAFSRDLDANSPTARSGVDKLVQYRVGTGLTCQSRILRDWLKLDEDQAERWQDDAERRFQMWATDPRASVEGTLNFFEMQELIARSQIVSGDVFCILARKERAGWPFRTALQVIEADRVCNENNTANTAEVFEGIKRATDGEVVSIFVANHHPYRTATPLTTRRWSEVKKYAPNGRRNFLHRMKTRRPGQTRGMPALSVLTGLLKGLQRFSEAELEAAVINAAQATFAQMSTDSFRDIFTEEQRSQYLEAALNARSSSEPFQSGRIINTLPGETITSPTPGRPNPNFGPFMDHFYVMLGMGLNVPKEVITGLFVSSYTAARASLQQLWQAIWIDRASDVTHVCDPTYQTWLFDCVADQIISAPGFLADPFIRHAWSRTQWVGSTPASLNPLQEAQAAKLRASFLTSEAEEVVSYDGGDPRIRREQQIREAQNRRENGLPPIDPTPAPATDQPTSPDLEP